MSVGTTLVRFSIIFLLLLVLFNISFANLHTEGAKSLLILYEGKTRLGEDYPILELLENYLRHFNFSIESYYIEKIPGKLSNYDCVLYLGLQERKLNKELLSKISNSKKVVWIEENIEQYAQFVGWKDFKTYGYSYGYNSIIYKGDLVSFDIGTPVYIAYPKDKETFSFLYDSTQKVPFVWKRGNLWYFGRLDFRDNSSLIFFDIVHDILDEKHKDEKKALLIIDDVTPCTSAEKLRDVLVSLYCGEVPINLVVYPKVIRSGKINLLIENKALVDILRLVEDCNGTIILGNYKNESMNDVENEIEENLLELARLNIFPIAYKLPDNSFEIYTKASKNFNLLLYNGLVSIISPKIILYPINIMGYSPNDPLGYNNLLKRAKEFRILRDAVIGIYFPSYAKIENLRDLIRDIRSLGYSFLDLRNEPFYVKSKYLEVRNVDGKKIVESKIPPLEKNFLQKIYDVFINYLSLILITAVSIFVLIILYLIRNKRRLYEIRSKK